MRHRLCALKRILFFTASASLLMGCTLDMMVFHSSSSSNQNQPSLKLSQLPTSVPESYPYYGQIEIDPIPRGMTLSLQDTTCSGLEISSEGLITGVLDVPDGETCEYKVKMAYGSESVTSDPVTLTVGPSLTLSFSKDSIDLGKGEPAQTVTLNLSTAAPFATYFNYGFYSSKNTYGLISGINSQNSILIPAGATTVDLTVSVPSSSLLALQDYQFLQLNNGMSGVKPGLNSTLYEPADLPVFEQVAVAYRHGCGISSGKLYCWGNNDYGQVGYDDGSSVIAPTRIGTSTTWQMVTAGTEHTCGIDAGKLFCWGRDTSGQLGNGPGSSANVSTPQQVGVSTNWQMIAAGSAFNCGINSGALYCWGYDQSGQIGNGSGSSATVTAPQQIGASTTWQWIAAGSTHACGIDAGKLYCWGSDNRGQVGNGAGSSANVTAPVQIGVSTTWQSVEPGMWHTCGIDDGRLFCWGDDMYGEMGNGDVLTDNVHSPEQVGTATNWQSVAGAGYHECGIAAGKLYCWGSMDYTTNVTVPTQVGTSSQWSAIAAGDTQRCGIDDGHIKCWGLDVSQSGYIVPVKQTTKVETPAYVGASTSWTTLGLGLQHSCGIDDGNLFCWGSNSDGQIGSNDHTSSSIATPQQIGNSKSWQSLALGDSHSCGINNGKLYCWGHDDEGQLGNGSASTSSVYSPAQIGTSSNWQSIAAGDFHTCGIESGKLYCWGLDFNGQVGNGAGSSASVESPEQIGTSTTWQSISAGSFHTCGINSGRLYCWGSGTDGQIGDGSSTDINEPTQIGTSTTWQAVVAGWGHTCGIDAGKLFCWGNDGSGQLGNGSASSATVVTPEQIGSSTSWQNLAIGLESSATCGVNSGKLYCWGSDFSGQMGNGSVSTSDIEEPTQVGTSSSWQKISLGMDHVCGIESGKLSCWGLNDKGQAAVFAKRSADLTIPSFLLDFTN